MAMLAEPRRRKRYNLCPRGKALYEDETRFGTKMLEKMGWSKGNGLGANEDGSKDFVRIRYKNDAEGFGYETRDDQWTEHEEGFNGLLMSLNGDVAVEDKNENASASEEESRPIGFGFKPATAEEEVKGKTLKEKISGVSLEEKSRLSKARVHYKKFTRGKDLAQYSEKDLANIFGKKVNDQFEASVEVIPAEESEEEVKPLNPNFAGVQTVSTGLSVNDYFKQKMEAMKNRLSNNANSKIIESRSLLNGADEHTEAVAPIEEEPVKKKKKKDKHLERKRLQAETELPEEIAEKNEADEQTEDVPPIGNEEEPVKKKKSKRERIQAEIELTEEIAPEKNKKKKAKLAAEEDVTEISFEPEESNPPKRKKKKHNQENTEVLIATAEPMEAEPKKKKKSKKIEEAIAVAAEETELPKKKSKKGKRDEKEDIMIQETAFESHKKSKKSRGLTQEGPTITEPLITEKNKKSKKCKVEVSAQDDIKCSGDKDSTAEAPMFLSIEQLIEKRDSFNEFKISSFCAERFQMLNMNAFKNSTLAQIPGYMIDDNIKLKIVEVKSDAQRIINLWEGRQSKYIHGNDPIRALSFKTGYRRIDPADIKKINRRKAFTGI